MTFHPQSKFKYFTKIEIEAAQWKGDNLDEMKELLSPYVGGDEHGPFVYASYVEDFFQPGKGYYVLQTEDDEFDPGTWVVVYSDGEIEGLDVEDFNKMGYHQ